MKLREFLKRLSRARYGYETTVIRYSLRPNQKTIRAKELVSLLYSVGLTKEDVKELEPYLQIHVYVDIERSQIPMEVADEFIEKVGESEGISESEYIEADAEDDGAGDDTGFDDELEE